MSQDDKANINGVDFSQRIEDVVSGSNTQCANGPDSPAAVAVTDKRNYLLEPVDDVDPEEVSRFMDSLDSSINRIGQLASASQTKEDARALSQAQKGFKSIRKEYDSLARKIHARTQRHETIASASKAVLSTPGIRGKLGAVKGLIGTTASKIPVVKQVKNYVFSNVTHHVRLSTALEGQLQVTETLNTRLEGMLGGDKDSFADLTSRIRGRMDAFFAEYKTLQQQMETYQGRLDTVTAQKEEQSAVLEARYKMLFKEIKVDMLQNGDVDLYHNVQRLVFQEADLKREIQNVEKTGQAMVIDYHGDESLLNIVGMLYMQADRMHGGISKLLRTAQDNVSGMSFAADAQEVIVATGESAHDLREAYNQVFEAVASGIDTMSRHSGDLTPRSLNDPEVLGRSMGYIRNAAENYLDNEGPAFARAIASAAKGLQLGEGTQQKQLPYSNGAPGNGGPDNGE